MKDSVSFIGGTYFLLYLNSSCSENIFIFRADHAAEGIHNVVDQYLIIQLYTICVSGMRKL